MATDVIATMASPGDDSLGGIFGNIGAQIQNLTNSWAALQAQNSDIANGRWTLNNAAYQFNQMQPVAQMAVMAAIAYVAVKVFAK